MLFLPFATLSDLQWLSLYVCPRACSGHGLCWMRGCKNAKPINVVRMPSRKPCWSSLPQCLRRLLSFIHIFEDTGQIVLGTVEKTNPQRMKGICLSLPLPDKPERESGHLTWPLVFFCLDPFLLQSCVGYPPFFPSPHRTFPMVSCVLGCWDSQRGHSSLGISPLSICSNTNSSISNKQFTYGSLQLFFLKEWVNMFTWLKNWPM